MSNPAVHGMQLPQPPADGITALRFASNSANLLVSSWDGVRCWNSYENSKRCVLCSGVALRLSNIRMVANAAMPMVKMPCSVP